MRNLKYLPLILIACVNLSILPVKAEEVLKPSELPAKHLVEEGNRKNELHDHEGAIADYKAALKIKPDYARAFFNLGVVACNTGDHHGEVRYFGKAFELNPADYEALTGRGMGHFKLGEIARAKEDFRASLKLNSKEKRTYVWLGKVAMHEGDNSAALNNFNKSIQLDPSFSPAYRERAMLYRRISRTSADKYYSQKAISDYNQVIKLHPEDASSYMERASFHLEFGPLQLAISSFQQAADILAKQGRTAESNEIIANIKGLKENFKDIERSIYLGNLAK
ncbi:tetratricopeptide repeat protein [Acaryochloris marina NIES-2412]|uniref:tetratricopeptide repeat protein n=1 Tax=Acaryochloris marina TaxID=155978 RepID=UPI004057D2BB